MNLASLQNNITKSANYGLFLLYKSSALLVVNGAFLKLLDVRKSLPNKK